VDCCNGKGANFLSQLSIKDIGHGRLQETQISLLDSFLSTSTELGTLFEQVVLRQTQPYLLESYVPPKKIRASLSLSPTSLLPYVAHFWTFPSLGSLCALTRKPDFSRVQSEQVAARDEFKLAARPWNQFTPEPLIVRSWTSSKTHTLFSTGASPLYYSMV
jgi:hypothetical protein